MPRGRLPVPCVGTGGGGLRGSCSPWGSGGPTGRADWQSCRGPGMLPRNCVPALCILPILSAPCPHVTKSLLRVGVPSPLQAPGSPEPECHVPTHPPRERPLLGMVGQSCFLSLKPSRDTDQTAPPSSQKLSPMRRVPGGPPGPGQVLASSSSHVDSTPLHCKARWFFQLRGAFRCWGPQAPADCKYIQTNHREL